MANILVVGGGIFGCTTAIRLAAAADHRVTLCDRGPFMRGATYTQQGRAHLGYHYPRSPETVQACSRGCRSFFDFYPGIDLDTQQIYCIHEESRTPPHKWVEMCRAHELDFEIVSPLGLPVVHQAIDFAAQVPERLFNVPKLESMVRLRLADDPRITLAENGAPYDVPAGGFDFTVYATYLHNNTLSGTANPHLLTYKVVEKPLVLINNPSFLDLGIVVIDGPFGCVDVRPMGHSNQMHAMGHVVESVIDSWYGCHALSAADIAGEPFKVASDIKDSRFPRIRDALSTILHVGDAAHYGSLFGVRATLSDVEDSDCRPTLVNWAGDRRITVFGGKIPTCVDAADDVVRLIDES